MRALPAHLSSFIFELSSFFLIFVSQKQFTATTMHLKSDTLLKRGEYRIIETLGRGGFGITYLAEQVNLHRKVCIKEFFPKDYYKRDDDSVSISLLSESFKENMSRFKAKFVKEAQTIATLNHANIIPIHDVFEENGTAYYVMDYIEGESLSERVKRGGAMSERDAVSYINQVASALEHIHARQIMHLDVKPGNIMVREEDRRAILIDFGLSKHYDATSGEATSTTPVGVSHGFAPMEQYQDGGVSTFSPETDIYSLGATLYFLVTGNVPPQATVVAEQGLPYLDNLSSNVRETIAKSMSYLRKDRPHTIKDFLALLDNDEQVVAVLADESEKTKIAPHTPTPKRESNEDKPRQKRSRWWLWLLVMLLIGCGAYLMFMGGDNAAPISNTTNTAKPQLDTFEPIVTDSITAMAELNVEDPNITAEDSASIDGVADIDTDEQSNIEAERRAKASLKLTKTSVTIPSDKGSKELSFTLKDPYDGLKVSAESNVKWITIKDVGSKAVYYDVAEHTSTDDRTGTITVSYNGKDYTYQVKQQGKKEEHPKPSSEPQPTSNKDFTVTVGNVSFKMIWVEGGSYWMGSPAGVGDDDERPQHKVTLDGYWIAETEVTQGLWRAVMNGKDEGWTTEYGKGSDYPAYYVSYNEAIDFCKELNAKTNYKYNFTLPTEAQWEYAARGGNKSHGYTYSGSNTLDNVAWYSGNSNSKTHVVKTKAANELGIYDMSGNVCEWCSDRYSSKYYSESGNLHNPQGPSTGVGRVLRGGSWNRRAEICRVANRDFFPVSSYYNIGFRLAVSPSL